MPHKLSLDAWLARLEQLHPSAIDLGLDRVRQVSVALGLNPTFPVITVGGTNGKGSTCAYLEAMLRAAGYKTGLYTSPHLLRYNERVRIAGAASNDADLIAAFERIDAARGETSLTYYEFGTLGAMLQFIDAEVDVAILEVGLGGRLDAVNIYDADAAIVTNVDLDHQDYLGDTRELIGFEKAGIYRTGRPAIYTDMEPPASLRAHVLNLGADAWQLGADFHIEMADSCWTYRGRTWVLSDLPPPVMAGAYQVRNAAGAIAALEALDNRLAVDAQAIATGLRQACVEGRFQQIGQRPEIVVDVAHNPHAARALAAALAEHPVAGRNLAVIGMLADKDSEGVIAALALQIDCWFVCTLASPRALPALALADHIRLQAGGADVTLCDDPGMALEMAQKQAAVNDRIVAFGSFYTVAAVLKHARSRQ